jgi:hypothetical protein
MQQKDFLMSSFNSLQPPAAWAAQHSTAAATENLK